MAPPHVLCIGGLDPSGGAGLAADARACAGAGAVARLAATCIAVQDSRAVHLVAPMDAGLVRLQVRAAIHDGVDAAKVGLLPDPRAVDAVATALPPEVPLVADPVLGSTMPGAALLREGAVRGWPRLLARAALVTPNRAEARALTGLDEPEAAAWSLRKAGARNVLVKGGDVPGPEVEDVLLAEDGNVLRFRGPRLGAGPVRGTGCTLAALAAAHLAQGFAVRDAVEAAIAETRDAIAAAFPQPGASGLPVPRSLLADLRGQPLEARARAAAVARAWRALEPLLPREAVPEVGSNLSFLGEDGDPAGAAALSARCVRTGRGVRVAGPVEVGGLHHTARVAAAAHRADPAVRAALNLRFRPEFLVRARALGWRLGTFRRADQPAGASSTVEWGTAAAIAALGAVPDAVYDEGGPGKEPMLRVLAREPAQLVEKARALLG